MPEPQPEAEPPATEPFRGVPAPRADEPAVPVEQPDLTRSEGLDEPETTVGMTETADAERDPTAPTAESQSPDATTRDAPAPTRLEAPRWTGSAPVPPAARRDRRGRALPDPRHPAEDRSDRPDRSPETATPVDPWADADTPADPWAIPGTPHPPESHPASRPAPTKPYPLPIDPGPAAAPGPYPPAAPAPASPAGPSRRSLRRSQRPAPQPPVPQPQVRQPQPQVPQPAPANWRAPHGYPPPPARRKRRWPSRMMLLTLLTIACCCGCPAYFGKPMWEQYPAQAALPKQVRDLTLRDDAASQRLSQRLVQETGKEHLLAEDIFAGVYRTSSKQVIVFGSTGFRLTPEQDVTDELTRLGTTYQITGVESVETSLRGQYQSCGTGRSDGTAVVVCTWADHGSLGTGVFTRLSVTDSATLLAEFRDGIVTRG